MIHPELTASYRSLLVDVGKSKGLGGMQWKSVWGEEAKAATEHENGWLKTWAPEIIPLHIQELPYTQAVVEGLVRNARYSDAPVSVTQEVELQLRRAYLTSKTLKQTHFIGQAALVVPHTLVDVEAQISQLEYLTRLPASTGGNISVRVVLDSELEGYNIERPCEIVGWDNSRHDRKSLAQRIGIGLTNTIQDDTSLSNVYSYEKYFDTLSSIALSEQDSIAFINGTLDNR